MSITGPLGPTLASALPGAPAKADPTRQARSVGPPPGSGPHFAELAQRPCAAEPGPPRAPGPLRRAGAVRATAPPGAAEELGRVLADLRRDEQRLDRFVQRARWGGPMEHSELLAMQTLVYRYSQRVELFSKLVERMTGALRQTLQTQL